MGLFHNNRVSIRKEIEKDDIIFFLNCHKQKELVKLKFDLMKELIGNNRYLVVIDTDLSYSKLRNNDEEEANELINLLDTQGICYRKIVMKKEAQTSFFGMQMKSNNKEKVNNYIIGFLITSDQLEMIESIADKFNTYYYAVLEDTQEEEILNEMDKIREDWDELDQRFGYHIVYDNFVQIIRIRTKKENEQFIEQVIHKLMKK